MNGACMGHCAVLMKSMLQFAMHFGRYRCQQCHLIREHRRKGLPSSTLLPAIDIATLLTDKEENIKLEQVNISHTSIMDLLDDPGNPLYTEPHSMAEQFNTMMVGAHSIGELPSWGHCRNSDVATCVYKDEAQQVCQKILRCLDMRVLDGDLIVLTCLLMPTLIPLPDTTIQMPRGNKLPSSPVEARASCNPGETFKHLSSPETSVLPANVREVMDEYFHREELEIRVGLDKDQDMSTDTEAAEMVRRLQVHGPVASASLQVAVRDALALATAAKPQEQEYYYDSDDLVLDLDEEFPDLAEWVVEWQAAHRGATSIPPWWLSDFWQLEQSCYNKPPDLRKLLNQARQARASGHIPVQSVAPMPLPFATMRDFDCQHQQCHDQILAKHQSSPLDREQHKWAKTPPQPDPYDAPNEGCVWSGGHEDQDWGCSRTRSEHQQQELDRACSKSCAHSKSRGRSKSHKHSKSHKCSKSCKCSKSRKCSKSHRHDESRACSKHEVRKPIVWSSQQGQSLSKGCHEEDRSHQSPSSTTQMRDGQHTKHLAPYNNELSKFIKLKEEVVKHSQSYIRGCTTVIFRTLAPDHEAVKCLMAFDGKAQKYAAGMLATIEWGTQHWKLQEPFPVPLVPKWLRMPVMTQTMMPLRGELPLIPPGAHYKDIRVRCPAVWAWMAMLLQYWQDHMTWHLYGGHFHQASDLANTLIWDINPWLPHRARFGWGYVATHTMLWLDI